MNERYLVHGKRKDNGEWVVGYYTVDAAGQEIIDVMNDMGLFESWHPIDPSTLGAYTGIADKNGERIFDGDIVEGIFSGEVVRGVIQYGSDAKYYIYREGLYGIELNNASDWLQVIGNIYDNPDLLEDA